MDWKDEAIERHRSAIKDAQDAITGLKKKPAEADEDAASAARPPELIAKYEQVIAAHEAVILVLQTA